MVFETVFEKSLTTMVKGIRANRGKESDYINSCTQEIRSEVASKNMATKSMAVLKLSYLNMMGYDMDWATFAIVEVMSHNKFSIKRPGYMASSVAFTDTTDVGLLTINLFKKDFGSKSQYETGMAISCLSSICTPQISRDILTDLAAMMSSSRAYLRKKTVLCLYRVFLKDPPALRTCYPKLKERLADEDQGVLTASVNTFLELARKNARNYLSLVPQLYHILVNTTNNWLTIKLLKLFQLLCPLEPRLSAKLVEPLTNILSTTKAASVEFEAIRTTVRTMPETSALVNLAIEKLQAFLNSSDRNLRYLALEQFKTALERRELKEKFSIPDVNSAVLQSIEENDPTARSLGLELLDEIVTSSNFVEVVKKLLEFSKRSVSADDFVKTILRIASRNLYALIEDFAWYLLVLADASRNITSDHATQVAEQFMDIVVRVAGVRPYAVQLALSILDREEFDEKSTPDATETATSFEVASPMIGACAWLLGEYHEDLEGDVGNALTRAAQVLLVSRRSKELEPAIQTKCIWAAFKLCVGAARQAPDVLPDIQAIILRELPALVTSTHVDVSERASLVLKLVSLAAEVGGASTFVEVRDLFAQPLLPVAAGVQKDIPVPADLNLDEPFYAPDQQTEAAFKPIRADHVDPYSLSANYKEDFGFLDAQEEHPNTGATVGKESGRSSIYYLGPKDADKKHPGDDVNVDGGTGEAAVPGKPLDPLELMRQKLAANRAEGGGAATYEVLRQEVGAPTDPKTPATSSTSTLVPVLDDKELAELQGRLWHVCHSDDFVRIYVCLRAKNRKKNTLRIEFRCERVASEATISDIRLKLPAGVEVQESDASGFVFLAPGELRERSQKVRMTIGLAPFCKPVECTLTSGLQYNVIRAANGELEDLNKQIDLRFPPATFLSPVPMTEDDVASLLSDPAVELHTSGQAAEFALAGKSATELSSELSSLVGRCAGLCFFYVIPQQQPPSDVARSPRPRKYLLVASPPTNCPSSPIPGQEALPEATRIICMCAATPRDAALEVKVTVKCADQAVCDDVGVNLLSVFRELTEGRLRSATAQKC